MDAIYALNGSQYALFQSALGCKADQMTCTIPAFCGCQAVCVIEVTNRRLTKVFRHCDFPVLKFEFANI